MARLEEHLPFPVTPVDAGTVEDTKPRSDFGRLPWTAFVIITVMLVVAVFAPLIARLYAQLSRMKDLKVAEMKAGGVEYEQRMEERHPFHQKFHVYPILPDLELASVRAGNRGPGMLPRWPSQAGVLFQISAETGRCSLTPLL
jgi:hypothetical protein